MFVTVCGCTAQSVRAVMYSSRRALSPAFGGGAGTNLLISIRHVYVVRGSGAAGARAHGCVAVVQLLQIVIGEGNNVDAKVFLWTAFRLMAPILP